MQNVSFQVPKSPLNVAQCGHRPEWVAVQEADRTQQGPLRACDLRPLRSLGFRTSQRMPLQMDDGPGAALTLKHKETLNCASLGPPLVNLCHRAGMCCLGPRPPFQVHSSETWGPGIPGPNSPQPIARGLLGCSPRPVSMRGVGRLYCWCLYPGSTGGSLGWLCVECGDRKCMWT